MREYVGLALLDVTYAGVGTAVLAGLGLVRTARHALLYAGVALCVGFALLGVADALLITAGLQGSVPEAVVVAVLLSAAALALTRRVTAVPPALVRSAPGALGWVAAAGVAAVLLVVEGLFRRARVSVPGAYDAWSFWLPKAKSLVYFHGIDAGVGGFTSFANPDYPPFAPSVESLAYRFAGTTDGTVLSLQHWVVVVGVLAALAALLARRVPPWILWPSLAALALMPAFIRLVGSSLGDEPLALLVALAGICAVLWLLDDEPRLAVLCGVFLAAAVLTKNEGLPYALLLAALLAATARGRRVRVPLALAAVSLAVLVPWKLWLAANDIPKNPAYDPADLLRPGYLLDRIDRLGTAVRDAPEYFLSWKYWLLAIPIAFAVAVALARRAPAVAGFTLGAIALVLGGNLVVYWVSTFPIDWYIRTTADRTSSTIAVLCAALTPLLVAEALRSRPTQRS